MILKTLKNNNYRQKFDRKREKRIFKFLKPTSAYGKEPQGQPALSSDISRIHMNMDAV